MKKEQTQSHKALIIEARAQIMWGELPDTVRQLLLAGGLSKFETDKVIEELLNERYKQIKNLNLKRLITHLISLILCIVFICFLLLNQTIQDHYTMRRGAAVVGTFATYILLWSAWKLIDALTQILRPDKASGTVGNI
jgi:protein-S-isoprenylcysteine O-methyltransferase Ste14